MTATPTDLNKALAAHPKAQAKWDALTPIARRDFTSWVTTAKQADTRARRVVRTCDMLIKGKKRPCCFTIIPMAFYRELGANAKTKAAWKALSADQKRDFTDWLSASKDSAEMKVRVAKACAMIAGGKKRP